MEKQGKVAQVRRVVHRAPRQEEQRGEGRRGQRAEHRGAAEGRCSKWRVVGVMGLAVRGR